jgi:hypothetical protein
METGELPTVVNPLFFQELGIEQPITLDVVRLGGRRFLRGLERTVKYGDLDISSFQLGHQQGFIHLDSGDGSEIKKRYLKWQLLKNDGFSEHTFQLCLPVIARDEQGADRFGLLTEDFVTQDSDIIDLVSYRTGERPEIVDEAARWLKGFMSKLHEGNLENNINQIANSSLREALGKHYERTVVKEGKNRMPRWDPYIEAEAEALFSDMETKGWSATGSSFFLQILRTHQDWWPYRRKVLIGDLGIGLNKAPSQRVEKGHIFDLIQYSYFTES